MNLFVVFIFWGHVAASAGPVPYGIDECRARLPSLYQMFTDAWAEGKVLKASDGDVLTPKDTTVACVEHVGDNHPSDQGLELGIDKIAAEYRGKK